MRSLNRRLLVSTALVAIVGALLTPARAQAKPGAKAHGIRPVPGTATARQYTPAPGQNLALDPRRTQTEQLGTFAPTTACVDGSFHFNDVADVSFPVQALQVEAWDADSDGNDDPLTMNNGSAWAWGITDPSGNYNICFDQDDEEPGGPAQDVYIVFRSMNLVWGVLDPTAGVDQSHEFATTPIIQVADGTTVHMGGWEPNSVGGNRIFRIYEVERKVFAWLPSLNPAGKCWDQSDEDNPQNCRWMRVTYQPGGSQISQYQSAVDQAFIADGDADFPMAVAHEIAHEIMDDVYEDSMPTSVGCPSNHSRVQEYTQACAWAEGFADWVAMSVYNSSFMDVPTGTIDLETATWGTVVPFSNPATAWPNGDAVESRVSGALLDIADGSNEQPWDRRAEGKTNIWKTFIGYLNKSVTRVAHSFGQFWQHRVQDGFAAADKSDLAAVYQNTIDIAFRDPLPNGTIGDRPTPLIAPPHADGHNFSFSTTGSFWSAVAIWPVASDRDVDMKVFDDAALATELGSSSYAKGLMDFVVIDSNRRALGDYYPKVRPYQAIGGPYRIKFVQGGQTIAKNTSVILTNVGQIAIRDLQLKKDDVVTIKAAQRCPGCRIWHPEVFVAEPGDPSVAGKSWLREGTGGGLSGPGTVSFKAPADGWYGVVVTDYSGDATLSVTIS